MFKKTFSNVRKKLFRFYIFKYFIICFFKIFEMRNILQKGEEEERKYLSVVSKTRIS